MLPRAVLFLGASHVGCKDIIQTVSYEMGLERGVPKWSSSGPFDFCRTDEGGEIDNPTGDDRRRLMVGADPATAWGTAWEQLTIARVQTAGILLLRAARGLVARLYAGWDFGTPPEFHWKASEPRKAGNGKAPHKSAPVFNAPATAASEAVGEGHGRALQNIVQERDNDFMCANQLSLGTGTA